MDFDADAAWEHVKDLTIRKNDGNAKPGKPKRRFSKWVAAAACIAAAGLFTTAGYLAASQQTVGLPQHCGIHAAERQIQDDAL